MVSVFVMILVLWTLIGLSHESIPTPFGLAVRIYRKHKGYPEFDEEYDEYEDEYDDDEEAQMVSSSSPQDSPRETGFDPHGILIQGDTTEHPDREALRAELKYKNDRRKWVKEAIKARRTRSWIATNGAVKWSCSPRTIERVYDDIKKAIEQ